MRTTVDIPDDLFRRVKARAAARGLKLRQYIEQALLDSLYRHQPVAEVRETAARYGEDALVLAEDCVLPQVRGKTSRSSARSRKRGSARSWEEEEVKDALRAGRRQRVVGDARRRPPAPRGRREEAARPSEVAAVRARADERQVHAVTAAPTP